MFHSVRIFEPCVERGGRNPVGLSDLDDRKCLAVNQVVGGVGSNFQNFLQFLDSQDTILHLLTHKPLLCALCAEVYVVVKVLC